MNNRFASCILFACMTIFLASCGTAEKQTEETENNVAVQEESESSESAVVAEAEQQDLTEQSAESQTDTAPVLATAVD